MRRLVRALKILGKGVIVLLVLIAITLGILRVVWGRQLAAEMEAIRARGEPLTMADFPQPKVPDSQNAALIYEQAFKALPKDDHEEEIMEALKKGNPASLAKAVELLKPYEKALALTEKAASMPECAFPPSDRNDLTNSPESKLRTLAVFLAYKARMSAGQGDADEALRCIALILRMPTCYEKQGRLIAFLCGTTRLSIASGILRKHPRGITINEAQARELYEAFGQVDAKRMYVDMLQAQRAYASDNLTAQRTDFRGWWKDLARPQDNPPPLWTDPLGLIWIKVFSLKDQTAYLHCMTQVIDSVDLTYQQFESRHIGQQGIPFYAVLARILAPVDSRTFATYSRSRAEIAGSQIFLALLAYHDRYGSYPASLGELRAKLGWPLQKDPFTGKDFIYRRQGKGFLLYSLDEDLRDNGGRPFAKYDEPRDIVWTISD
jgi:hypothetical protein